MKLASWNIRGFGAECKKNMINSFLREENIDLIGLIETKHSDVSQWEMRKCWGHALSDYQQVVASQHF